MSELAKVADVLAAVDELEAAYRPLERLQSLANEIGAGEEFLRARNLLVKARMKFVEYGESMLGKAGQQPHYIDEIKTDY